MINRIRAPELLNFLNDFLSCYTFSQSVLLDDKLSDR